MIDLNYKGIDRGAGRPGGVLALLARWWGPAFGIDAHHAVVLYPLAIFLLISAAAMWVARLERDEALRDVRHDAELIAPVAADRLGVLVMEETRRLRRLAREIGSGTITTADQFVRDPDSYLDGGARSLKGAVWLNEAGVVQAVTPGAADVKLQDEIGGYYGWADAWRKSHRRANVFAPAMWVGEHAGTPSQWICLPYTGAPRTGRARGAVVARIEFANRAARTFEHGSWRNFQILIDDADERLIYASRPAPAAEWRELGAFDALTSLDSTWHVHVNPSGRFVAERLGRGHQLIALAGIVVALLASLGTAQALLHRRRDRTRTAAHLAALEALSNISAAMSDRPSEATGVLSRLAQAAARLMSMSKCSVTLYDESRGSMNVVYRDGIPSIDGRDTYHIRETPCSEEAMRTGRAMMFGDVESPGSPFRPGHMAQYEIRALVILPLFASGKPMGVILLADPTPRAFGELDRRLTELWMVEARAILSNRKLYDEMTAALQSQQRILRQRETLYEVNTKIQHAGSLHEALRLVAELSPRALAVDACVVCLSNPLPEHIEIAAITDGQATPELVSDTVVRCATCAGVLQTARVRLMDDLGEFPVRGFPHMGSALFVPLTASGATIGLLVLLRRQRGPFDEEQVRVAELFASRAASAIESARLHDQTRRQAETNATLLRELNHRVGNNLASIVALLSMGADELPPESTQWLHRAVERVSMMARAHELFSGGVQVVGLEELARTTLASVSAVKRADVRVSIELGDVERVRLPSSRAITLAMVLHELAYNAVVHALAERGGDLVVRGRALPEDRVAIDVIDRPAAVPVAAPSSGGNGNGNGNGHANRFADGTGSGTAKRTSGVGLQLVRNLVTRELRGSFTLSRSLDRSDPTDAADAGAAGTVATVEIPIDPETSPRVSP